MDAFEATGNIRIRGKRENIIHFLQHELVPVYELKDDLVEERPIHMEENCGGWSFILRRDPDTSEKVYLKGSDRYFIYMEETDIELEISEQKITKDDQIVIIEAYEGPWNPNLEFFQQKAIQNKVDIRIFLWGKKNTWASVTTFYRNGAMEEESRQYADWLWDNPIPSPSERYW